MTRRWWRRWWRRPRSQAACRGGSRRDAAPQRANVRTDTAHLPGPENVAVKSREVARIEMPAPLRREVRLLGDMLGQVLAEYGGPGLLDDVENLRRTVIVAREKEDQGAAARLVASWPIDRAEQVARAFTCYFQLVNLAEERHRARALRERDRPPGPPPDRPAQAGGGARSRQCGK